MTKFTPQHLATLQNLPLELKIEKSKQRIIEFYEYCMGIGGDIFVSFSGGKDSTVLLNIVRDIFPSTQAVFCDTGLEYPEIKSFVKNHDNTQIIRPEYSFKEVLTRYGYPIISKDVASHIQSARNWMYKNIYSDTMYHKYQLDELEKYVKNFLPYPAQHKGATLEERTPQIRSLEECNITKRVACILGIFRKDQLLQWNPKAKDRSLYNRSKHRYLLNSDFRISNTCCHIMKTYPMGRYMRDNNIYPIVGTTAEESQLRRESWLKYGCNIYGHSPVCRPLSFWTERDILEYIDNYALPIVSIYGKIIKDHDNISLSGVERTGCIFCGFGCHLEKEPNRFQLLRQTHPKLYDYCMNGGKYNEDGW